MSYYVRALSWKKQMPHWKVQFISYKNEDIKDSSAKKPKKEWDIHKDRWRPLGFHSAMTIEDARSRAKQLNAQIFLKRQEEEIKRKELERSLNLIRQDSVLPSEFVAEFENRFIRVRDSETENGKRRKTRSRMIWQAAQRMIFAIKKDPSEWFYCTHQIYDHFYERQLSLRYVNAILKFANLWGFFLCRKLSKPFLPIPTPKGYERQRLIEAYYRKSERVRRPSKPLAIDVLQNVYEQMNRSNFNWLYLSVWFGLRPQEIDNLKNKDLWSIETLGNGRMILWVFQTKIVALPPEDRWKPIPILFEEQRFALRILESGRFKRPIAKTMNKYFGAGTDLYGGRKGFTDLMLSKGQALENISIWMGHSTLERTWRSYKNKRRFHLSY